MNDAATARRREPSALASGLADHDDGYRRGAMVVAVIGWFAVLFAMGGPAAPRLGLSEDSRSG